MNYVRQKNVTPEYLSVAFVRRDITTEQVPRDITVDGGTMDSKEGGVLRIYSEYSLLLVGTLREYIRGSYERRTPLCLGDTTAR
jgi:hypothetical protein